MSISTETPRERAVAYLASGHASLADGHHSTAERQFSAALNSAELCPHQRAEAHLGRAQARHERRNYFGAEADYSAALGSSLRTRGQQAHAHSGRAAVRGELGYIDAAMHDSRAAHDRAGAAAHEEGTATAAAHSPRPVGREPAVAAAVGGASQQVQQHPFAGDPVSRTPSRVPSPAARIYRP
jgi:hypothetical protein